MVRPGAAAFRSDHGPIGGAGSCATYHFAVPIEYVVILLVLIVGTLAALGWWRIAARMAPYDDEKPTRRKRTPRGPEPTVVKGFGDAKRRE